MSVVGDTGPLIAFAKADRLSLLQELYGEVLIPPAVEHELFAKASPELRRIEAALGSFLHVTPPVVPPPEVRGVTDDIDPGEAQAIALAYERTILLLADDRIARARARMLHVSVTGTAGVLIDAKRAGLVPLVVPVLELMRKKGYWLSGELLDIARRLSSE